MQGACRNSGEISSFADPFGFGSGGSLLSNFFDRDPFNDPFFTRPFGSPFGSIFGSDGFFGDPFGERAGFNQEYRPLQQPARKGPVIEELPDDEEGASGAKQTGQEPIVEDPDDDENQEHGRQGHSRSGGGYQDTNGLFGRQAPSRIFTFQSSSVTYGGPNGAYYTTSTTRRAGPNGVVEEEHREADSTTCKATQRISRGIGEKGHSFTRKRNSDGKVATMQTLHNLDEDEIAQFDEDWERRADKYLPGWKKSHIGMLENSGKRESAQRRHALPSNELNTNEEVKRHNETTNRKKEGQSLKNQFSRRWFGQRKGCCPVKWFQA